MLNPFLSSDQQAVVVFLLWKTLGYWKRMFLSVGFILGGLFLQYYYYHHDHYYYLYWFEYWQFWLSLLLLFVGNLFLMVRGFDTRIRFGKYAPEAEWERVDESKLLEAEQLARKIKGWKKQSIRSILDSSSRFGGCLLVILIFVIFFGTLTIAGVEENFALLALGMDAGILLFPHWLTGKHSIFSHPKLLVKIEVIKTLLNNAQDRLQNHQVEYFMLLKGKETKVPDDVKFCVKIQNQHPDFLGLYAQIVLNRGTYPYFYVVLVTKKDYGLREAFKKYTPPSSITKEYPVEKDVDVLVIRQVTTKTSGYHTGSSKIREIFLEGLELAETVAVK
jgi:hypothetical protein